MSAKDLILATDIVLKLPGFMAAVNASIAARRPLPTTSVIINVLYDVDYTGHGSDPNGTLPSNRTLARLVDLTGLGMSGLFAEPVWGSRKPKTQTLHKLSGHRTLVPHDLDCFRPCPPLAQATSPYYVLPYVVWNFPNTKNVTMANIGFRGSVLAPNAGVCPVLTVEVVMCHVRVC